MKVQQLFLSVPASQDFKATLDQVLNLCPEVAHLEQKSERNFNYALIVTKEPISQESFKFFEDVITNDKWHCDLLLSEDFPAFSLQNNENNATGALVMDMDMTTVQIEGIDEIARILNVYEQVANITHEAMNGKLDFSASLKRRVALLKGGDAKAIFAMVKANMPETSGLSVLFNFCDKVKEFNTFKTCIASGGFHELISKIDDQYHLDHIRANRFILDQDDKFTGEVVEPIVDSVAKAQLVEELVSKDGINRKNIIALGDGANDLKMIKAAGLGIAYHAKPSVRAQSLNAFNHSDLGALAVLLELRSKLA